MAIPTDSRIATTAIPMTKTVQPAWTPGLAGRIDEESAGVRSGVETGSRGPSSPNVVVGVGTM
jgi:hypothetical protein